MKREYRKEQIRKRKNFLPTLILTAIFWLAAGVLIYFVEPDTLGALPLLFVLIFFASLFTFSTIFASSRRGLIASLGLTIFLILRYLGIGNVLNLILIAGLAVTIELYFLRK